MKIDNRFMLATAKETISGALQLDFSHLLDSVEVSATKGEVVIRLKSDAYKKDGVSFKTGDESSERSSD